MANLNQIAQKLNIESDKLLSQDKSKESTKKNKRRTWLENEIIEEDKKIVILYIIKINQYYRNR